jgi:hypothetical protein
VRKLAAKYPDLLPIRAGIAETPPATLRDITSNLDVRFSREKGYPITIFAWAQLSVYYDRRIAEIDDAIAKADRKLDWIAGIEAEKEKKRQERARIGALLDRARSGAEAVKVKLPRDHPCFQPQGRTPQLPAGGDPNPGLYGSGLPGTPKLSSFCQYFWKRISYL